MVPTEVLAEQHHMAVRAMTAKLDGGRPLARLEGRRPLEVALLTNRTTAAERARLHGGLRSGGVDLVVGTQALLTDAVQPSTPLGLVVIDEQHRFGVEQRAALREKGRASVMVAEGGAEAGADPDLLVMTATPIPRTAAMVVFGDLDMVVLDEMPPGRTPITTVWARGPRRTPPAPGSGVRDEVAGRVARPSSSARWSRDPSGWWRARPPRSWSSLSAGELAGLRLRASSTGRCRPRPTKEAAMAAFRSGDMQVLVATTVVEVGVDVPEAHGHGRSRAPTASASPSSTSCGAGWGVGAGPAGATCSLGDGVHADESAERLAALERTTDGFELAEVDLDLRGEGTILGARQKGRSDLRLARLRRDRDLLEAARRVAEDVTVGRPPAAGGDTLSSPRRGAACSQWSPRRRPSCSRVDPRRPGLTCRAQRAGYRAAGGHPAAAEPGRHYGGAEWSGWRPRPRGDARDRRLQPGEKLPPPPGPSRWRPPDLGPGPRGPSSTSWARGAGSRNPWSSPTCSVAAVPSGSRPCRAAPPRPPSSITTTPPSRRSGPTWPPRAWAEAFWSGHPGAGRAAGVARASEPAFDLALCDPPYASFDDWEALLGALCAPTSVVLRVQGRSDRSPPGLGWSRGSAATAVRSSPWRKRPPDAPATLGPPRRRVGPEPRPPGVKVALFPGSFDPFHNGHLEVVERATRLFDEVVVAALRNPQKSQALFDLAERQEMLQESTAHLPGVRIVSVATLVVIVATATSGPRPS